MSKSEQRLPLPKEGWFVWSGYPFDGRTVPQPEKHPVLILETEIHSADRLAVHVAYCTSQQTAKVRAFEVLVNASEKDVFTKSHLMTTTKINLNKTFWLPWTADWFPPDRTLPIGELHQKLIPKLAEAWKRRTPGMRPGNLVPWMKNDLPTP